MSTKSAFLTAAIATTPISAALTFSAPNTGTEEVTCTSHGKNTGFGPVRLYVTAEEGDALPTGLAVDTDYWLIYGDANTVKFAASEALAFKGTAVNITGAGQGTFTMKQVASNVLIGAGKAVTSPNTSTERATCTAHGKATGFGPVRLVPSNNADDALPAGLAVNTNYWLIVVDANTIKFATTEANAIAGTAINLTGTGAGTFTVFCTMQTLADTLQDMLDTVLTFPGMRDMDKTTNQIKLWEAAVAASTF
jgi:hypothetical protein